MDIQGIKKCSYIQVYKYTYSKNLFGNGQLSMQLFIRTTGALATS